MPFGTLPTNASLFDLLTGLGFHRHYTGVLTPRGVYGVDRYVAFGAPVSVNFTTVAGGSLPSRTYYFVVTYVDGGGESLGSIEFTQAIAANSLLKINAVPHFGAAPVTAVGYKLYAATSSGAEVLQTASFVPFGSWTEPVSGLVTGTAVPPIVNTTGWQVFNDYVPDPCGACSFITDPVDTGVDDTLRVFVEVDYALFPGQSGSPSLATAIDTWLTGESDPGTFTAWPGVGYIAMRYLRAQLSYAPVAGSLAYITGLTPTIDTAPVVETGEAVVVAPGGTAVIFPAAFHLAPQVVASCVSSTGLYVTVVNVTATGCTFHVWNASGVDVGGTINYEATGE